jgi:hypothetical protein
VAVIQQSTTQDNQRGWQMTTYCYYDGDKRKEAGTYAFAHNSVNPPKILWKMIKVCDKCYRLINLGDERENGWELIALRETAEEKRSETSCRLSVTKDATKNNVWKFTKAKTPGSFIITLAED